MNVLVVSGIWPPDVGGPASHAPEVAGFLRERGHRVEVVVTANGSPPPTDYPVHWISRRLPKGVIHLRTAAEIARCAAGSDIVYTTGMFGRSAAAARATRTPYVLKLTADPAFERARRRRLVTGTLDEFQALPGGIAVRALRLARDLELRGAAHVFTPSSYLRDLAVAWGVDAARVSVLPNPAPEVAGLPARDELRSSLALTGPTLAFAGRLTAQKSLDVAIDALALVDDVTLVVAGEGDERAALERRAVEAGLEHRVRLLGAQPRPRVLELFAAADAAILTSSWENFPHGVVEALAVGTPVIATATGGVAEIVTAGENGLLVPPGDPRALAEAIRRFFGEEELRRRLRDAARASVAAYAPARVFGQLEQALSEAAQTGRTRR